MTRSLCFGLLIATLAAAQPLTAAPTDIVSQSAAAAHGLTRSWIAQVAIDGGRAHVAGILLSQGTLFVQTSTGMIHAFDAETGKPVWGGPRQFGNDRSPVLGMDANDKFLAVVGGSRVFVINRRNGELLWDRDCDPAPTTGPVVSSNRVYVPLSNRMIAAYLLKPEEGDQKQPKGKAAPKIEGAEEYLKLSAKPVPPLTCRTMGRLSQQPILIRDTEAEDLLAWSTDEGSLVVGRLERTIDSRFVVRYRLDVGAEIDARPAFLPADPKAENGAGTLFVAGRNGFVHAITDRGEPLWRFPTGDTIIEPISAIDNRVFACAELGGMFCIDPKTGEQKWFAPSVTRFLAASPNRVFAADKIGRVYVLDAKTGGRLDTLGLIDLSVRLVNQRSDRLYLATPGGLIQCLHDVAQAAPAAYRLDDPAAISPKAPEKKATAEKKEKDETEKPAAEPKTPKKEKAEKPAVERPAKKAAAAKKGKKDEDGDGPFGKK